MQVTARELKLRLGRYLEAVRRGETVRVTMRGQPVAEIRSLGPSGDERLASLVAQGLITPGKGRLPPHTPERAKRSGAGLILAERDAEDDAGRRRGNPGDPGAPGAAP
jgi:prevent-host-death family protein